MLMNFNSVSHRLGADFREPSNFIPKSSGDDVYGCCWAEKNSIQIRMIFTIKNLMIKEIKIGRIKFVPDSNGVLTNLSTNEFTSSISGSRRLSDR